MKRHLFLLLVTPILLTSCKGMYVSADEALTILDTIGTKYEKDGVLFDKVTYKYKSVNGDLDTLDQKVIYDRNAQFYYSYSVTANHIYEEWHYVKDKQGVKSIYNMKRNDGKVNDKGDPDVTGSIVEYQVGLWKEIDTNILDVLAKHLEFSLEKSRLAVNYKKALPSGDVAISAFNDRSLCVEGKADYMDFTYQIDNYLPTKYHLINNDSHYVEFNADYSKAIINYLNM